MQPIIWNNSLNILYDICSLCIIQNSDNSYFVRIFPYKVAQEKEQNIIHDECITNVETYRNRQGQTGTDKDKQGQAWMDRDRQGQVGTSRDKKWMFLFVFVFPCLDPACPCLSLLCPC